MYEGRRLYRHVIILNILFRDMSDKRGKMRIYRKKIRCNVCKKEMDSDYKSKHINTKHKDLKEVTFTDVVEKSQKTIQFSTASSTSQSEASCSTNQPDINPNDEIETNSDLRDEEESTNPDEDIIAIDIDIDIVGETVDEINDIHIDSSDEQVSVSPKK